MKPLTSPGAPDSIPAKTDRRLTDGRYYVATRTGVHIFLPDGTAAGTISVPQYPGSLTFGGGENGVLYMVGESSVWSIQTRVHGFRHPVGMN